MLYTLKDINLRLPWLIALHIGILVHGLGSNVDDVDFIKTIIEIISDQNSIDQNRIYSTGMSNGGFMSYHLACNLV